MRDELARPKTAYAPTRLTSELICQHCMDEAWDVAFKIDPATSPTPKGQDSQKEQVAKNE